MKLFMGKRIWLTGASSGIGEALAYRFAREGAALVLTARNKEKLDQVAIRCAEYGATSAKVLPFDLGDLDGLAALAGQAWSEFDGIDIFINNAGISQRGSVIDTEMSVMQKVIDVDFYAPVILVKQILPRMTKRGGGQLAVTSSINGLFGFPLRCAYSSAKHALYGFFETVQAEYYDKGIRVTMICPGRVRTNISVNALEADGSPHNRMDEGQAGGISSEKAADKIARAIFKKKREVLVGGKELAMVYIKRFFPGLCARLARTIDPT